MYAKRLISHNKLFKYTDNYINSINRKEEQERKQDDLEKRAKKMLEKHKGDKNMERLLNKLIK